MTSMVSKKTKRAVRALNKLFAQRTEGWDEHWECDRGFDGGEYSDGAWGRNFERAYDECIEIVSEHFGVDQDRLSDAAHYIESYENFRYVEAFQ